MKFTVGQLAKIFNISPQSIHSYVEMGILPCNATQTVTVNSMSLVFKFWEQLLKTEILGFV